MSAPRCMGPARESFPVSSGLALGRARSGINTPLTCRASAAPFVRCYVASPFVTNPCHAQPPRSATEFERFPGTNDRSP
jgi:hypothetical protein